MLRATALFASLWHVFGCEQLLLTSDNFPDMVFKSLTASESHERGFRSGRGVYINDLHGDVTYLYHTINAPYSDGVGRWVISRVPGSNEVANAFVDSWAVMPNLVHAVNDPSKSIWKVAVGEEFIFDESLQFQCLPVNGREDNTIYLEVRGTSFFLSGFYVQVRSYSTPMFSHVRSDSDPQYFLYKSDNLWIIGEQPGSRSAVAYVHDEAIYPGDITNPEWQYPVNGQWTSTPTTIIKGDHDFNIYANLRSHRFIPGVDGMQTLRRLRNELPIPAIGLGTATIDLEEFQHVAEHALLNGYRLFDMSREYENEALLAELLHHPNLPKRNEVFIISKVWPTHLGYAETNHEITQSLKAFQDPYLDMFMIHWPRCDPEVKWMRCEESLNPEGNLLQSYRSLERAYAEGRIGSIGVCNVDAEELDEIALHVSILPHAVQTASLPGELDLDVRIWCFDHHAAYFPFAYQRNGDSIPDDVKEVLGHIAYDHGTNEHLIMTRFFLQTGAVVTPGSANHDHIVENIRVESLFLNEDEMEDLGWPSTEFNNRHASHAKEL